MEEKLPEPSAWLVTGGRTFMDRPYMTELHATDSIATRKDGARSVPLYTADQMRAAILAERERCAELAKSYATCGCGGAYGRCMDNDVPLAIAAAICKG